MHYGHTKLLSRHQLELLPYRLVFGKACHLPFKVEHKPYWVVQKLIFDAKACGERRLLELAKINEMRRNAYENAKLYKERTKLQHDRHTLARNFVSGYQVLLCNC